MCIRDRSLQAEKEKIIQRRTSIFYALDIKCPVKYRWDKKYLYWGITAICVIVVSLLVFAAIFEFKGVLSVIGFIFRILSPVLYRCV